MSDSDNNYMPKKGKSVNVSINIKNLTITLIVIVVLGLVFWLGWHFGENSEMNKEKTNGVIGESLAPNFTKHRALVGTVSSISSSQITVAQGNKQNLSAKLNSSTVIRNTKGQNISASAVKTGSRVIVTAAINSDQSLTAQNILIIQ